VTDAVSGIQIRIDASQGLAALNQLRQAVRDTSRDLSGMGGSASGFSQLSQQIAQTSSTFQTLSRSMSSGGNFAGLSRELSGLSNSFGVVTGAVKVFAAAMGGMALSGLAKQISQTGNSFLGLRLAVDSAATSSGEAGQQMKFLFNLADKTGSNVEDLTNNFRNLNASMRASGSSVADINKVTSAFATISSVLHLASADTKTVMREIGETFSIGSAHAQQLTRSIALHIPGMMSMVKQAMHMTGSEVHAQFKKGGFDPQVLWPAVADVILEKYGSALPTALQHSQAAMNQLSNVATKMRLSIFENGFDQALTQLSHSLANAFNDSTIESIGKTIGAGLRSAAAGAIILGQEVIRLKEPLAAFFAVFAGLPALRVAILGLGAAFSFATSPLVLLATGAALAASNWDSLKGAVSTASPAFGKMVDWIADAVSRLFDLNKALKGALELFTLTKGLLSGEGWDASLLAARKVGADFDAAAKASGKTFAQGWIDGAKGTFDAAAKWLDGRFAGVASEYNRLMKETTPEVFTGAGNYSANSDAYSVKDNSLSEEMKREWERIAPLNKALLDYRLALESLEKMNGKIDPLGHVINDADIAKLKDMARETALRGGFPAAAKISEMMDRVKMEREALANVGNNSSKESLDQEKQFLQIKYDLLKKHVQLRSDEEQALRGLIAAEHQLAKGGDQDPFTRWANAQRSAQDSLNESISSGMDTLADGLSRAVTSGKDLRSTLQGVLKEISATFIRQGIRTLMSDGLKQMNLGSIFGNLTGGKDSISAALSAGQSVLDRANGSLDKLASDALSTATIGVQNVQAGIVNITGTLNGASGLTAFKPSSDITRAVNPSAVGGIAPNNASAPLFSSNALGQLPGFKDSIKTGGLGAITKNSVAEFGKDLVPSLGALPGFKDALKSSADGITRNSVAAFGQGLQRQIAPVAERIGVKPLAGNDRDAQAWNFFRGKGYSESDTSKILGNIKQESSFNPLSINRNDAGPGLHSYGIAQWNRGRFASLQAYAAQQGKPWQDYQTQLGFMHREIQSNPRYLNALRTRDGGGFGHAYEGFGDNSGPTRTGYANQFLRRFGGKQSADLGKQLNDQTAKTTQEIQKQLTAQRSLATETQKSFSALAKTTQPLGQFDSGVTKIGETMSQGIQPAESFTSEIEKLLSKLASGLGGGGGGLGGGIGELLGGLFQEGGIVGSAVSSASMPASFWSGAPAFAEGTPNTSGGLPAILHPNEAVIPLSRGRSVPVEIKGGGEGGNQTTHNVVNVNIAAKDHDSFRRSKGQIGSAMSQELSRLHIRNG